MPSLRLWFLLLYLVAILSWLLFWYLLDGYRIMRTTIKKLWLPFGANLVMLGLNAILNFHYFYIGEAEEEEALFNAITARLGNVFTASTAVLAIAALIYTIRKERASKEFVNFASYTFIFGLTSMFILWIPDDLPVGKFLLRHFQTIFLCCSISLCMGSILILLEDLTHKLGSRIESTPYGLPSGTQND
jgi:hypothetical protein